MSKVLVNIIDYGVGNTQSIKNVLGYLGYKVSVASSEAAIRKADILILPGVGAFGAAMNNLAIQGLLPLLNQVVLEDKKPILGICLGMQLMATYSEEYGFHKGLNWIAGGVIRIEDNPTLPVPHVGWNNIVSQNCPSLFSRTSADANFYFDHSYYFKPEDEKHTAAYVSYGSTITAAVQKDNIFGVQFHPEKSQINGLKLFRSFIVNLEEYA